MPFISRAAIREISAKLGHRVQLVPLTRGRFAAECNCGMVTSQRRTEAQAASAGIHHLTKLVEWYLATGHPIPDTPMVKPVMSPVSGRVNPTGTLARRAV